MVSPKLPYGAKWKEPGTLSSKPAAKPERSSDPMSGTWDQRWSNSSATGSRAPPACRTDRSDRFVTMWDSPAGGFWSHGSVIFFETHQERERFLKNQRNADVPATAYIVLHLPRCPVVMGKKYWASFFGWLSWQQTADQRATGHLGPEFQWLKSSSIFREPALQNRCPSAKIGGFSENNRKPVDKFRLTSPF